jgi:hypothetical protein
MKDRQATSLQDFADDREDESVVEQTLTCRRVVPSAETLMLHEHVLPTDLQTFSAMRCGESCPLIKPLGGVEWLVAVMG